MLKAMGSDDYMMILCQLFFTAYLICQIGGAVFGTGRKIEVLTLHEAELAIKVGCIWDVCEVVD